MAIKGENKEKSRFTGSLESDCFGSSQLIVVSGVIDRIESLGEGSEVEANCSLPAGYGIDISNRVEDRLF